MTSTVHILDRFVPELERFLLIEDIGCYLIAEGLLSNEDYLMLVRRTSKKEAVVELLQMVKRKGPDSLQSFLYALNRACTESSTPHEGHNHLYDLIQDSIRSAHMQPLKKQRSKSIFSLKRNKSSKSSKEVSLPLWVPTPHSTLTTHQYNPSLCGATISPLTSRYSIISSGTSDEDNNRNSIYDSTSSQDSSNPELSPPRGPPPPSNTHQCVIEELQKENKQLKTDLEKKTKELEKCKATVKEQSLWIEDLKAVKEKYKSKMQSLKEALQIEANEHDSLRDELEQQVKLLQLKIQEAMQEKESLKKIMRRSPTCGSGSKSRRAQSLGHRASRSLFNPSTSLTSIHEIKIEELKTEVNKTDEVFHSKLGELAQMCEEPSKLNRRWHSDNRLVQHYHRDNNFSFLHSQT